jgi:hypothetical protein
VNVILTGDPSIANVVLRRIILSIGWFVGLSGTDRLFDKLNFLKLKELED